MKRLFHIAVVAVLVALVTGCGGMHSYDARLVAADSLMWADPDSALAIVTAIDSLAGERDQAYRDLLATQARYKCYAEITASDDSAITRAMDYYRHHSGDREKLTRSYLYKGAVMEELGHVDSAMYYYKTAEVNADPKDYYNLGYSKMRIAELYESQHSQNDSAIIRLKDAINYFGHLKDTTFLINCYGMIGSISGIKYPDSTQLYLTKAIELAQHFDPPRQYTYKSNLAGLFFYHNKDYPQAKALAMDVLRNGSEDCLEYQFYYYAIFSFLKMGQIDSAKYVLSITPPPIDAVDSMNWFNALAEVAQAEGDNAKYSENAIKSRELTSQILIDSKEKQLIEAEHIINNQLYEQSQSRINYLHWALAVLGIICILPILFMFIVNKRRQRRTQEIIEEIQKSQTDTHDLLSQFDAHNTSIGHLIANLIGILKTCAQNSADKQIPTTQLARQIKESIVDVADSGFWDELRSYLDHEHDNMISRIADNPDITKKDLKLIELSCVGFSYLEIAMILDYSPRYVLNKRKTIAQKLGLQKPLPDYLNDLMTPKGE
jgi:DNA-binding CsgD family transcriptional regulator/tetratricopeptide (TPR) repeat protein